jgi:Kef-type K+ transport system membrane component KefB
VEVGVLSLPLSSPGWIFAVLMAVVLLAPIAAERARIPGVVGLVLAGVLIGPHTTGLLQRDGSIALLGSVGLLYLMFVVGLELELDDFRRDRNHALLFGVLTFVVPMALGSALIPLLGFSPLASILLASCWASHTLLAYPVFRRLGTSSSRAVAVSVGATIVTDTAALLVLAVVARAHTGGLDATFWVTIVPSMAALGVVILVLLPRLARWFFGQLGQDRSARFVFLLVALFASAGLAELAGVEAIVGAFLAGLALNRTVAKGSALADRVDFFGSTFLIPIFLVSVGMVVDPAVLTDPRTLGVSAAFTAIALVAKWLAAYLAGKALRYDGAEIGAMFSLSGAQAAATLAAVIVGLQIGLLDEQTVNAVIGVILVTCLVTSWTAGRYAPRLPQPPVRTALGRTVVVPVSRPESAAGLVRLAAAVARRDAGMVVPLVVVPGSADEARLAGARALARTAEGTVLAGGGDAEPLVRIDDSAAAGTIHTIAERSGTFLVLGWKGYTTRRENLFGGVVDSIVAGVDVPVLIGRLGDRPWRRVVLLITADDLVTPDVAALEVAVEVAARVAADGGLPIVLVSAVDAPYVRFLGTRLRAEVVVDEARRAAAAVARTTEDDLVVLPLAPVPGALDREASRVARALPRTSVVAVLAGAGRRAAAVGPPVNADPQASPEAPRS